MDNENNLKGFKELPFEELPEKEKLGVLYFAGIDSLKQKIEDNTKLLFKLCTLDEDNAIFSTLFFLFVIITGNDPDVKNTLLKCKEEEFREKNIKEEDINSYIDSFNLKVKELATLYLDVNSKCNDDLEFQNELIKSFSSYLINHLKIEETDDAYDELKIIFLSALKIAFTFRDKKDFGVKDIKEN